MTDLEQVLPASHSMDAEAQLERQWYAESSTAPDSLKPPGVVVSPHTMYELLKDHLEQPASSSRDHLEQPVPDPLWVLWEVPSPSSDIVSPEKFIRRGPPELADALDDLNQARQESQDEGYPTPSDAAIANAHRLLREMSDILPRRFEVYPTQDGEIAIDAPAGHGRSVILLCDSDGGALCLVNNDGDHRRARYSNANKLPDGFLREALDELKLRDDQAA